MEEKYEKNEEEGKKNARHKLELPIRWNETNSSRRIELVQPHTLVEPAIVQLNGVNRPLLALVDHKFVVQAEFTFRGASKVGTHDDVSVDVRAEDGSCMDL